MPDRVRTRGWRRPAVVVGLAAVLAGCVGPRAELRVTFRHPDGPRPGQVRLIRSTDGDAGAAPGVLVQPVPHGMDTLSLAPGTYQVLASSAPFQWPAQQIVLQPGVPASLEWDIARLELRSRRFDGPPVWGEAFIEQRPVGAAAGHAWNLVDLVTVNNGYFARDLLPGPSRVKLCTGSLWETLELAVVGPQRHTLYFYFPVLRVLADGGAGDVRVTFEAQHAAWAPGGAEWARIGPAPVRYGRCERMLLPGVYRVRVRAGEDDWVSAPLRLVWLEAVEFRFAVGAGLGAAEYLPIAGIMPEDVARLVGDAATDRRYGLDLGDEGLVGDVLRRARAGVAADGRLQADEIAGVVARALPAADAWTRAVAGHAVGFVCLADDAAAERELTALLQVLRTPRR